MGPPRHSCHDQLLMRRDLLVTWLTILHAFVVNSDQTQRYPASLSLEIAQIHAYWEDALYAVTSFPKAEEKNWRVLVMIEQIVEDRKLLGPCNDADKRVLVEVRSIG